MKHATDFGPVTRSDFDKWLSTAQPGDRFTYHVGRLAADRDQLVSRESGERTAFAARLNKLARHVLSFRADAVPTDKDPSYPKGSGHVALIQRRVMRTADGTGIYEYIAERTAFDGSGA